MINISQPMAVLSPVFSSVQPIAQGLVPGGDAAAVDTRITRAGDTRITRSADIRITR